MSATDAPLGGSLVAVELHRYAPKEHQYCVMFPGGFVYRATASFPVDSVACGDLPIESWETLSRMVGATQWPAEEDANGLVTFEVVLWRRPHHQVTYRLAGRLVSEDPDMAYISQYLTECGHDAWNRYDGSPPGSRPGSDSTGPQGE